MTLAVSAVDSITIALKNVANARKHKEELAKLGVDTMMLDAVCHYRDQELVVLLNDGSGNAN